MDRSDHTSKVFVQWPTIKHWFPIIHEDSPQALRQALLDIWDSEARILITSHLSELDLIVRDAEIILFFFSFLIILLPIRGPFAHGPEIATHSENGGHYWQTVKL